MIYPTINDLTKGEYNRYEIALATAKCARMITNEYACQRLEAERVQNGNKENDKPLTTMIDKEVRDEKAVKLAIGRIYKGDYTVVHKDPAEQEREEEAILAGLNRRYDDYQFDMASLADEDGEDEILGEELAGDEYGSDERADIAEETDEFADAEDEVPSDDVFAALEDSAD